MDFYIALRHTGGSRWDLGNTECYIAWCGEIGLANRWSLWEWALGLPGNRFFQAGLLGGWVCSLLSSGSVQEEEKSPL